MEFEGENPAQRINIRIVFLYVNFVAGRIQTSTPKVKEHSERNVLPCSYSIIGSRRSLNSCGS